jgi:NTP pyrophosphatase (non-canonical NTP hydrolase)
MNRHERAKEGIQALAVTMEEKLEENAHKPLWDTLSDIQLCKDLQTEVDELVDAVLWESEDAIQKECADVANFAMMLHDNVRRRTRQREYKEKEKLVAEVTYCNETFMLVHTWDDDARTNMQILSVHAGESIDTPDIYDFLRDEVLKDLYKLLVESYCA